MLPSTLRMANVVPTMAIFFVIQTVLFTAARAALLMVSPPISISKIN